MTVMAAAARQAGTGDVAESLYLIYKHEEEKGG